MTHWALTRALDDKALAWIRRHAVMARIRRYCGQLLNTLLVPAGAGVVAWQVQAQYLPLFSLGSKAVAAGAAYLVFLGAILGIAATRKGLGLIR